MGKLLLTSAVLFVMFVMLMFTERFSVQTLTTPNAFMQQLMNDSRVINAQWTWRDVYPGRDTMERALGLLRNTHDGASQQLAISQYQAHIDWRTSAKPRWNGSVLSDSNLPPPHVYALVLRPPDGQVRLGDLLVMYGTPLNSPRPSGNTRNICFAHGVCITIDGIQQPTQLRLHQAVLAISYLPTSVVQRSLTGDLWQGFRRY